MVVLRFRFYRVFAGAIWIAKSILVSGDEKEHKRGACVMVLPRVGVSFLVMNGRRLVNSEFDFTGEQGESPDSRLAARQDDSAAAIDDATEAADEMAAKSAVLVEMMEDLEERLRRRMANSTDPAPVYSRKVRRFQSLTRNSEDGGSPFSEGAERPRMSDIFDGDSEGRSGL